MRKHYYEEVEKEAEHSTATSNVHTGRGGGEDNNNIVFVPKRGGVAAVFTEFPSNPLLKAPNLKR